VLSSSLDFANSDDASEEEVGSHARNVARADNLLLVLLGGAKIKRKWGLGWGRPSLESQLEEKRRKVEGQWAGREGRRALLKGRKRPFWRWGNENSSFSKARFRPSASEGLENFQGETQVED